MQDKRQKTLILRQLADKIRKRRFEMNQTQEEVALVIDCNLSHYSEIERGKINPSYLMILRIAKALLISPKDLMPE